MDTESLDNIVSHQIDAIEDIVSNSQKEINSSEELAHFIYPLPEPCTSTNLQ